YPNEHFGRCANQLLVAHLQDKFVRTRAGFLNSLKKLRGTPMKWCTERLPQHDFVIVAFAHAFAHSFHFRHVLLWRVIRYNFGTIGTQLASLQCGRVARQSLGAAALDGEVETVPLNHLLLAIHEVNVIAEKQMETFVALARQPELDGVELQKQIVPKSADKSQSRVLR